jgi:hypothetical protein
VKLSENYQLVDQFEALVPAGVPSLVHCNSLTIEGELEFEAGVEIVGDVKFVARGEGKKRIRSGTYQDRVIEL